MSAAVDACELCESPGGGVFWRDERCRVVHVPGSGQAGLCRVIWNRHVAEMTDLAAADRQHLMSVVFAVEAALRAVVRPDKINLASLGNQVPHLHWHVIPRWRDDRHFPGTIWSTPLRTTAPERAEPDLRAALLAALMPPFASGKPGDDEGRPPA